MQGEGFGAVVARPRAVRPAVVADGPWRLAARRLRRNRGAMASVGFIVLLALFALAAPLVAAATGHGPNDQDAVNGLDVDGLPVFPGVNGYVLGADGLGRDLLVRLAYGARVSLGIGVATTVLTLAIAIVAGTVAGWRGGIVDTLISRAIDLTAAFPFLLFAIAMSVSFGASVATVVGVIVVFSWFYPARIIRGEVLALRDREFVLASRMLGASGGRIVVRHVVPHLVPLLVVYGTLSVAAAISFEAALSFLGFGLPPDVPSWGRMIADATRGGLYTNDPWLMVVPGTALFGTILAFNVLGDGLRDALDPRGVRR